MNDAPLAGKEGSARKLRSPLPVPATVTMFALFGAAFGILVGVIEGLVKVGYLFVPPLVVLAIALLVAILIAFRWRWMPTIAALYVLVFLVAGALLGFSSILSRLTNPQDIFGFTETWIQMLGMLIAAIAGITATIQIIMQNSRSARKE